jgi:hypothetical protein
MNFFICIRLSRETEFFEAIASLAGYFSKPTAVGRLIAPEMPSLPCSSEARPVLAAQRNSRRSVSST